MRTSMLLLMLLSPSASSFANAQQQSSSSSSSRTSLLNAYNAPLSALTAPHSHYFLEFPLFADYATTTSTDTNTTTSFSSDSDGVGGRPPQPSQPRCEDGSPYSFLFRRGTNAHVNKLLVEFEGFSRSSTSTPWSALQTLQTENNNDNVLPLPSIITEIPPLGSCTGISEGFLSLSASFMGFGNGSTTPTTSTTTTTANAISEDVDVPIFLRGKDSDTSSSSAARSATSGDDKKSKVVWWEHLSGDYSDMHDWSYLFVPHCTPSDAVASTVNVQAVTRWVTSQFKTVSPGGGGLDALVTIAGGGRIGGCSPHSSNILPTSTSSAITSDGDDGTTATQDIPLSTQPSVSTVASGWSALSFAKTVSDTVMLPSSNEAASSSSSSSPSKALVIVDVATTSLTTGDTTAASLVELMQEALLSSSSSSEGSGTSTVEVAWVASSSPMSLSGDYIKTSIKEEDFLQEMEQSFSNTFHVYRPVAASAKRNDDITNQSSASLLTTCPLYAFSDMSDLDDGFANFLHKIVKNRMPWGSISGSSNSNSNTNTNQVKNKEEGDDSNNFEEENTRLSFLSIFLILLGLYLLSWLLHFSIEYLRQRRVKNEEAETSSSMTPTTATTDTTPSPHDLWFLALTNYPTLFLLTSIIIPIAMSYAAYARGSGGSSVYEVNLDFDSYLDIDTKEERVAMQYNTLLGYQQEMLMEEEANCELLYSSDYDGDGGKGKDGSLIFGRKERERALLFSKEEEKEENTKEEGEENNVRDDHHNRALQSYGKRDGRTVVNFFYQNRNGGTVFTPSILESIREFEESLLASVVIPTFREFCYGPKQNECYPFNSIVPYFFPGRGSDMPIVEDIDGVLRSLVGSKDVLAKMDKYFSKENLGSNVTLTNIMLNDVDGRNEPNVQRFLKTMHRELWKIDQDQKYPDLIISWSNDYMQEVEAADALEHDLKWSLAALCFIALMVFVKVRNVFEVLAGVLGLVLSFTSALYWQYHFNFDQLTAMHVAGIYVMLGIGADDIFLTIDSFEHTKVDFLRRSSSTHRDEEEELAVDGITRRPVEEVTNLDDPEIIKQRMISSYKAAGSMLLVSSVTTAICFFSNIFSALVSISDFGSYMGMVVVLNYIHVMTILPSAMLVNEFHIKPFQRRMWIALGSKPNDEVEEVKEENNTPDIFNVWEEDEEVADIFYLQGGAETGITATPSSQTDNVRQENGRGVTTPEIITSTSEVSVRENEMRQQTPNDYTFLDYTEEMTPLDRYFVQRHAPFVHKWRRSIVAVSLVVAISFGILAWLNFTLYDGTIIVFKEKYNLGRVQRVIDEYFPEEFVSRYLEDGLDDGGNVDKLSDLVGGLGGISGGISGDIFSGSTIFDVNSGGDSAGNGQPTPTASAPTNSPPNTGAPTTRPISSSSSTTTTVSTLPPTGCPPSSQVSMGTNVSSMSEVWYPSWTGDIPGCLNDGLQPDYIENYLYDTKVECCDKNYALNPIQCLGVDSYIDAFLCDGAGFNSDSSFIVPNTELVLCIKSKYSDVEIDYINNMLITQGDVDLAIINNDAATIPSITSRVVVEAHNGVVVRTRIPMNMFDYNDVCATFKIYGRVAIKANIGAGIDASEEASFELNVNLWQESSSSISIPVPPNQVTSPLSSVSSLPTSSLNASASQSSPVWYPDWGGGSRACLNDGLYPSYMNDNRFFLFGTMAECCDRNFVGDGGFCLGIDSNTTTPSTNIPSTSPFRNPTLSPTVTKSDTPNMLLTSQPTKSSPTVAQVPTSPSLKPAILAPNSNTTAPSTNIPSTSPFRNPTSSPTVTKSVTPNISLTSQPTKSSPTVAQVPTPPSLKPAVLAPNSNMTAPSTNIPSTSPFRNPTSSPTVTKSDTPNMSPTSQPTKSSPTVAQVPTPPSLEPAILTPQVPIPPSLKPTVLLPKYNCPPGLPCIQTNGDGKVFKKREYYAVSLVWGMRPIAPDPNIWVVRDNTNKRRNEALGGTLNSNYIDPSDPYVQEWLLELVTLARNDVALRVHPQLTWIEALREVAAESGIDFPIPRNLFIGLVELLKARSIFFRNLVNREIATRNPGIQGEFLFTGITVLSEVPLTTEGSKSEAALRDWTNFTGSINELLPENLPPVNAQSEVFMDSYRMNVIVKSTLSSYFFANGLIVLVILLFMGNLLLTLMVMASLILILLCFGGLILFVFKIEFGPVESLGVSIFVGLTANYLLHIAHSYHNSNIKERNVKIQRAVFITGSPILWSAISTIGGSMFLFACRTWLLTELGILICTIIALSLIFSVGFLLALLAYAGPLPILTDDNEHQHLHSCDLVVIIKSCFLRKHTQR